MNGSWKQHDFEETDKTDVKKFESNEIPIEEVCKMLDKEISLKIDEKNETENKASSIHTSSKFEEKKINDIDEPVSSLTNVNEIKIKTKIQDVEQNQKLPEMQNEEEDKAKTPVNQLTFYS